jgi:hypothetical protein
MEAQRNPERLLLLVARFEKPGDARECICGGLAQPATTTHNGERRIEGVDEPLVSFIRPWVIPAATVCLRSEQPFDRWFYRLPRRP